MSRLSRFVVTAKPKTIDEYIGNFSGDIQKLLNSVRQSIKEVALEAEETISYGIPTFKLNGNLVHFAGYKNHIGLNFPLRHNFHSK